MKVEDMEIFMRQLREVRDEAEKELIERKAGVVGDCTVEEIENKILPEIYHYMFLCLCRKIPQQSDYIECAQLFTTGNVNSRMANLILKLAEKYN